MTENKSNKQGRGWHGDSAGHAKAGRKGGRARAKNQSERSNESISSMDEYDNE